MRGATQSRPFRLFCGLAVLLLSSLVLARAGWMRSSDISLQTLPSEARETLVLIDRGGPFPFRRDGIVFQNRERQLPAREHGCYREYTVPTPGERDRGARRIVAACEGVQYYSDDHYRSFRKIHR